MSATTNRHLRLMRELAEARAAIAVEHRDLAECARRAADLTERVAQLKRERDAAMTKLTELKVAIDLCVAPMQVLATHAPPSLRGEVKAIADTLGMAQRATEIGAQRGRGEAP
jgi:hypothetical protein